MPVCRLTLNGTQNVCARPVRCPQRTSICQLIYPEMATAFDYLPENAIVIIEDTPRLRDAVRDFTRV